MDSDNGPFQSALASAMRGVQAPIHGNHVFSHA